MPTDPSLLLVEGQDDRHFVKQLWEKDKGSKPSFGISDREGFDNLIKVISQGIKTSGREVFGILVDANSDPTNRWEQITSKLKQVASELSDEIKHPQLDLDEIPDAPDPNGTIIDSKPRIGIWLMPNNQVTLVNLKTSRQRWFPMTTRYGHSLKNTSKISPSNIANSTATKCQRPNCSHGSQRDMNPDAWGRPSALMV